MKKQCGSLVKIFQIKKQSKLKNMQSKIKKLRDREALRLWDKTEKTFIAIQLNRKEKYVCWERWISKDKRNWIKLNDYLSLREVWIILQGIKEKREIELLTD